MRSGRPGPVLIEAAKDWKAAGRLRDRTGRVAQCQNRKRTMLRKTDYDNVPVKPLRVYEEMNKYFGRDTRYVSAIGLSQIAAHQLQQHQLEMVLHNLPAGDWTGGERGHPNRVAEFEQGVETALAYASVLGTQRINCLVGVKPQGVDDADARAVLVRNLKFAAVALKKAGIPLLVEPINTFDIPGFFLSGTRQGLELIECSERKRALCPFPHRARPC